MPTITATAYNTPAYVLVEVDWTDMPQITHAGVTRRNTVTGETVNLRPYTSYNGDGMLALNCGIGLWWDTEPPLNVPLEYCTVAADIQTVITSNPDFEVTTAPWTTLGTGTLARSNVFAHQGTFSGLLTPGVSAFSVIIRNQDQIPFDGGTPLTMSTFVLSPQGWHSLSLHLEVRYDNGIVERVNSGYLFLDPGNWRYLRHTFTPPRPGVITAYEFATNGKPPNTTLFYIDQLQVTQAQPVTATTCDTVTVVNDSIWLKSPHHPCDDVEIGVCTPGYDDCGQDTRVTYAGMQDEDRPPNTTLHEPDGQEHPIPVNRRRRSPRGTLRLITHDCDARDRVIAANAPGDPLLFQAPAEYCIPDRYLSIGVETETRFSVDQREPFRFITLPYTVVRRPEGAADAPCGIRVVDLCDIYSSWQSIFLNGLTYYDLLLGAASYDSPTNPPPAAMRTWDSVKAEFVDWDAVEAGGTRTFDELRDGL